MISFLLTTYNRPSYLKEAVESILSETQGLDHELLILDHGSTDPDTWPYLETLPLDRVQVFRFKENRAPGGPDPWTYLLQRASGEFCVLQADDDTLIPHTLESKLKTMESSRHDVLVGSYILMDESGRSLGVRRTITGSELSHDLVVRGNCIALQTAIFKTEVVRQHWCPDGPLSDWDMWLSMLWSGVEIGYYSEPSVRVRVHLGSDSNTCGPLLLSDMFRVWSRAQARGWKPTPEQYEAMTLSVCAQAVQLIPRP